MKSDVARKIMKAILADVTDRGGWAQEWDQFDDEVRREIRKTWTKIINGVLTREN